MCKSERTYWDNYPVHWDTNESGRQEPGYLTQMVVQLYKGIMKVYTNQVNVPEGSSAVVEHKDKDQAASLEIAEWFILCKHQANKTYRKSVPVLFTMMTESRLHEADLLIKAAI
jgi:hypothetical protein